MAAGVLFVHNNFPAQFRGLTQALMARGVPCAAIAGPRSPGLAGVTLGRYGFDRGSTAGILPQAVRAEADLIRGLNALRVAKALKAQGFEPQVIVGHPGWGETLYLDQVWPGVPQVLFNEFFYHARGLDVGFDPEFGLPDDEAETTAKAKNAITALALTEAFAIVTSTRFQASTLPPALRARTRVIHEGVDTDAIRPGPPEPFALADGRVIAPGTPVITHVNNRLEPMRGLHIFARALPRLMAEVPDAQVLVFGDDSGRPYGADAGAESQSRRQAAFAGLAVDPRRLHFLGRAAHAQMLAALRLSTAHVYYSYPFVLSWSLIEAMAGGGYIIGSDTAPLHDAIEDGVNGRLLPFFDVEALSQAMVAACREPAASAPLRAAARETAVARFSARDGLAAWLQVLGEAGLAIPPG